jgi:hypothetical protein
MLFVGIPFRTLSSLKFRYDLQRASNKSTIGVETVQFLKGDSNSFDMFFVLSYLVEPVNIQKTLEVPWKSIPFESLHCSGAPVSVHHGRANSGGRSDGGWSDGEFQQIGM